MATRNLTENPQQGRNLTTGKNDFLVLRTHLAVKILKNFE
jgi:hypothetical protein